MRDVFVSRDDRFSLAIDDASGRMFASFPVSNGLVEYSEDYELTGEQFAAFVENPAVALGFVEECRRHEHDELLRLQPGTRRGLAS